MRFRNVSKMVIFGHFVKPMVRAKGQRWPIFGVNFKVCKKDGKFNRDDDLT